MDDPVRDDEKAQQHSAGRQLLVFGLADEDYAIDVTLVEEVLEYTGVTRVPRTPEFLLGVVNVRGRVVPVMDLRIRLGVGVGDVTEDTRLVVATLSVGDDQISVGVVADSVEGVVSISPAEIESAPRVGTKAEKPVSALGHYEDRLLLILDTNQILTQEILNNAYELLRGANRVDSIGNSPA